MNLCTGSTTETDIPKHQISPSHKPFVLSRERDCRASDFISPARHELPYNCRATSLRGLFVLNKGQYLRSRGSAGKICILCKNKRPGMAFEKSVKGTESSHQAELNNSRNDTYHKSKAAEVTSSLWPETALFF